MICDLMLAYATTQPCHCSSDTSFCTTSHTTSLQQQAVTEDTPFVYVAGCITAHTWAQTVALTHLTRLLMVAHHTAAF